jgi:uncharacterized protein (TIGR03437 family)
MPSTLLGTVLRVVLLSGALGAAAKAQTPVSLNFNGSGSGQPNSISASGSGTMDPFGEAAVTFTSGGASTAEISVSITLTFTSGGTLTATSPSVTLNQNALLGSVSVTGGTGEFVNATGTFSFTFTTEPEFKFNLTGSGSISNIVLPTTSVQLPAATVGVPYSVDVGQGLSQIPPGSAFQLAAGASLPAGLTLSTSGLLSGTPTQIGNYAFSVEFAQATAPGGTLAISLNVMANSGPAVAVQPGALNFSLTQGSTSAVTQSIVIVNSGGSTENFMVTATPNSPGNWLSVFPSSGTVAAYSSTSISVSVNPSGLAVGTDTGTISISVAPGSQQFSVAVLATVSSGQAQLQISQSGLRFQTTGSGGEPQTQSITVLLAGAGSLNFSASTSTTSGGSGWLSVSPASGTVTSSTPATVVVSIHSENLAAGAYYGQIQFSADGAINSPQTASVVLNVAAAGTDLGAFINPYGLIFVGTAGGTAPPAQMFSVTNPSTSNLTYSAAPFFGQGNNWFTVNPANGVVNASNPGQISVQTALAGLAPGVYSGEVVLYFAENNSTKHITVLLIVVAGVTDRASQAVAASACTPTKLLPVFTQLGANFTTVAAWPTPIAVTVVDDCGNFLTSGNVTASFSDSDPSLPLTSLDNGNWSATWQPRNPSTQVVITVDAMEVAPPLQGAQSIGGALQANPSAPSINSGGVVSAAKSTSNQPLAPGSFISIYGVNLSAGQNPALSLPLATQLGATEAVLGGRPLPLQYAATGQVNAIVPYDLPPNTTQQLIIANGPALSVPEPVVIAPAQPAVFAQADGSGVVFDVKPGQTAQVPVDTGHPMSAGDAIVIYCAGLGPVNPLVAAGSAAPSSPPATTINPVTVTIGGKTAQVFFGGLVGGFAGLYQVNAYVPKGIAPGDAVPLVITISGFDSAPVYVAVQ